VIDPFSGMDAIVDLRIQNGRIAQIARGLSESSGETVLDATGRIVCPGLIDPHVHLREPGGEHKETIETGARAAVAGGFTTVCCMPNTTPPLDSPEALAFVGQRSRGVACRVFPVAAATQGREGERLTEIRSLAALGAAGFSDDGDCLADAGMMKRALGAIAVTGLAFMQHAQEPSLTPGAQMHAGGVATRLGLAGWPREAEEVIVDRDVRLAGVTGCRYHVQHVSSAGTVEVLRRARAEGLPVSGEASPHHLHLTHEACEGFNTLAKVNPPLRERADVEALRAGVAEGVITVLATDHAPHGPHEKGAPFEQAPFGMVGLETALSLYAAALVGTGLIDWPRLIALLTLEPARLCGLERHGLGRLKVGGPGDVTIIDPDAEWVADESALAGKSSNTAFLGRRMRGRALATVVGGRLAHEIGSLQA